MNYVIAGLMLGIFVASLDNTIVATAMPTIVGELGQFDQFVWVTSAYMIATVAGMPIFGKLSDMYGRKMFFLFGLTLFIVASMLCGIANSMTQLAFYRALQGLGGGALMPIAFTIIFDALPADKRGKITGLFGAVFGLSSIIGPLLGAFLTDAIGWRWIFYINAPIGAISIFFIYKFYHESGQRNKQKIDWGGAITLVLGLVSFMFAVEFGGKDYAWDSVQILGLFGLSLISFIIFGFIERKASEPIITFSLFKRRLFASAQLVAFFYGLVFISASVYIPIFIQGVYGGSATNSGLILMPMMLGSVVTAQIGGRAPMKFGFRNVMIVSGILLILGLYLLSTMDTETPRWMVTLFMVVLGLGVGFSFSLLNLASIQGVPSYQRGSATSVGSTFRTIGMALGVTIFGSIQQRLFTDQLSSSLPGDTPVANFSANALSGEASKNIPGPILEAIQNALSNSISTAFLWSVIPAIFALIVIFMMGKERMSDSRG
ncbi:MDR family MFS transporter [Risungbinella massiliensis]|uniref:MDR family MFS transporter n=1 Tax=Risungbinella massiliensis TaxID=1329796 RepID=UPI0005CC85B2|nr:MDR family MFS transporter [Risungbinella massiliensis]